MNVYYTCNDIDNLEQLKYRINYCLMKVRGNIFDELYTDKNESGIQIVLVKMLIEETCEFIISQNYVITQ